MNIHNRYRTIYFARVSRNCSCILDESNEPRIQSGQSLLEHSYKADSDLSPVGWDYAEKLAEFVLERRAKNLEARGLDPAEGRLVVRTGHFNPCGQIRIDGGRSGHPRDVERIIPHGRSSPLRKLL